MELKVINWWNKTLTRRDYNYLTRCDYNYLCLYLSNPCCDSTLVSFVWLFFTRLNHDSSVLNLFSTRPTTNHFGILNITTSRLQILWEKRIVTLLLSCQTCNYGQKKVSNKRNSPRHDMNPFSDPRWYDL